MLLHPFVTVTTPVHYSRWVPELESSSYFFHATLEHFKKGLRFFASKSLLKSTGAEEIREFSARQ